MTATRILVVEDEPIVGLHLKRQLIALGYEVAAVVASGEAALRKVGEMRPDLVLMDILIDGALDGIDIAARIPVEFQIPVIYLTAYAEEATLARARSTGAYGFLVKPFSERELHATIQIALERRRWDSALQAAQAQVTRERDIAQRYLDIAGVMILVVDVAGNVALINRLGCRILGYEEPKEIVGKPWIDTFIPVRKRGEMQELRRGFCNGEASRFEFHTNPVLTRTGGERLIAWRNSILEDENGRFSASLSSGEDVTERNQAEERLRQSEERFRSIFGAVSEGIFITDPMTGLFIEVNDSGCAMHGYGPGELNGKDLGSVSSGEPPYAQRHAVEWIEKATASGQPQRFLWHSKCKDGRLFWTETSLRIATINGQAVSLAVLSDITERRAVDARLRQALKMEAVGQLTGGIAHDFNNLLAVIHGNLELLKDQANGDPELDEMAGDALRAAKRGAGLTQQLLAYSRQQPLAPQVIGVTALVADLVKLLHRTLQESIEIGISMQSDLWAVRIDPNQLVNALLNLAVNARDAMPGGGKLTLTGANAIFEEGDSARSAGVSAGSYVLLTVVDTGTGMPKEVLERIFEPFFTTKAVGHGTGLGLSMVIGFVKQSGGHLKIHSAVGRGTTVRLYLPRADSTADDRKAADDGGPVPRSIDGEVILVLEDDEAVRKLVVRVLAGLGYRTIQAADGPEALRMLNEADRVDLLLTDVVLPKGLNGPAVALEARTRRPGLGLLYMSGYAKDIIVESGMPGEIGHLLTKPFARAELASRIRTVLDGRGTP